MNPSAHIVRRFVAVGSLLALTVAAAAGCSQADPQPEASPTAPETNPPFEGPLAPAPEMTRLIELLDGHWDTSITYAPSERAPEGGTGEGQETSRPGPGGLSLLIETSSNGPSGPYEAGGIIEWSPSEQVYKLHWMTSMSQVGSHFEGRWVGEDLVFDGTEAIMGETFASRHSITDIRSDAFLYTIDLGPTPEQLRRAITIEYSRRPADQ